jgi:hypothetical protein
MDAIYCFPYDGDRAAKAFAALAVPGRVRAGAIVHMRTGWWSDATERAGFETLDLDEGLWLRKI